MQTQNRINFDALIERGRKLQSQTVFDAFRQGLLLMKNCLGKKTRSYSPRNGSGIAGRSNNVLDANIAK